MVGCLPDRAGPGTLSNVECSRIGMEASEQEALLRSYPAPCRSHHCRVYLRKPQDVSRETGIWIFEGNGRGIYGGKESCGDNRIVGVSAEVNCVCEEKSGDGGVYPVSGRVSGRIDCPRCSQRSELCASLGSGASGGDGGSGCDRGGGGGDGVSHLCWTSSCHPSSCEALRFHCPCCALCSCSSFQGSGVCGCCGGGLTGGRAPVGPTPAPSYRHFVMICEGLVDSWTPMVGGADFREELRSLPKQFVHRRRGRCRR